MQTKYNSFIIEQSLQQLFKNISILEASEEPKKVVQWDVEEEPKKTMSWDIDDNESPKKTMSWDIQKPSSKMNINKETPRKVMQWNITSDEVVNNDTKKLFMDIDTSEKLSKLKKDIKELVSNIKSKEVAKDAFVKIMNKIKSSKFKTILTGAAIVAFATILSTSDMLSLSKDDGKLKSEIEKMVVEKPTENVIDLEPYVNDYRTLTDLEKLKINDPKRFEYATMPDSAKDQLAKDLLKNESEYLNKLAFKESTYRPWKRNDLNYIGLFQFGNLSMIELRRGQSGIKLMKKDDGSIYKKQGKKEESLQGIDFSFRRSHFEDYPEKFMPDEQIKAIKYLTDRNKHFMRSILTPDKKRLKRKYRNLTIGGKKTEITISGVLAAAHLIGASDLTDYIKRGATGKIPKDANGKSADEYMREFNNLSID